MTKTEDSLAIGICSGTCAIELRARPSLAGLAVDVDKSFARAVDAGCTVQMPLENQFWGDRYGSVVDPFGHVWEICTHIEDVTPEEMQKRMLAMKDKMAACAK